MVYESLSKKIQPMPHRPMSLAHEDGSILLVALATLVFLSILGAISLRATDYELKLSGNDKVIARQINRAESTAAAAAELLEIQPDTILKDSDWLSSTRLPWLSRGENDKFDVLSNADKYKPLQAYIWELSNWISNATPSNSQALTPEEDDDSGQQFLKQFPNCKFQVIDVEVSQGASLQTGNTFTTMHNLYITGLSIEGTSKRMVQIGYRKVY